jgi:hypothetical protein
MTPSTPQDYRDRAAESERLAETFEDRKARETLYHVASRWRAMADADEQREQRNHPSREGDWPRITGMTDI